MNTHTPAVRFCAHCGERTQPGAAFCIECGAPLPGTATARSGLNLARWAPLIVFGALLGAGALAIGLGYRTQPPPNAPIVRNPAPPIGEGSQMPGDHPPVEVSEKVREVIERMQALAAEQPENADAWKQLAFVLFRAGQVNPTYLEEAAQAYQHVLDRNDKDIDALRGLGNIAYDRNRPGIALDYYRRVLAIEPGDKGVRTDMGTMLLAADKAQEAIDTYLAVLQEDPTFFQAQFNLAIAYRAAGRTDLALAALHRAVELAPDDQARERVRHLLARVDANAGDSAGAGPRGTLRQAVEAVFRSHPIVGPRIDAIQWSSETAAKVVLREFPMAGMPPMVREKFTQRLHSGIRDSKRRFKSNDRIEIDLVDATSGGVMASIAE